MELVEIDAEEQALRDAGREADIVEERTDPRSASAEQTPGDRTAGQTTSREPQSIETDGREQTTRSSETESNRTQNEQTEQAEPQRGQQQRDPVTQRFVKGQEQPPEGDLSRQQKEEQRKDRSWQALDAEKHQFRQQKQEFEDRVRMGQLDRARQAPPVQKDGLDAKGYF